MLDQIQKSISDPPLIITLIYNLDYSLCQYLGYISLPSCFWQLQYFFQQMMFKYP